MTGNQVAYWRNLIDQQNYLENQRLGWARYHEQVRSDQAQEAIGWTNVNETIRHNKAYEAETNRHNVATERYNYDALRETIRNHGVMESIAAQNAATQRYAAESNYALGAANIQYQYSNLAENTRHNKEAERQNNRQIQYNRWYQEDRLALDKDINKYNQTVGTIKTASDIVANGIRTVAGLFK